MEPVQLSGRFEGGHFFGRWRFDGSPSWFDFDLEKDKESFKGHFHVKNKNGIQKIPETLTLSKDSGNEMVGTGSNMFGEFQLWGKKDEKTNAFEGFKKYTQLRSEQHLNKSNLKKKKNGNKKRNAGEFGSRRKSSYGKSPLKKLENDEICYDEIFFDRVDTIFDANSEIESVIQIEPQSGMQLALEDEDLNGLLASEYEHMQDSPLCRSSPQRPDPPLVEISGTVQSHEISPLNLECSVPYLLPQISQNSMSSESCSGASEASVSAGMGSILVARLFGHSSSDDLSSFKGRARKRVRDFVVGLQNRHFFPYDQNDLAIGLPASHPLRKFVKVLKADPPPAQKENGTHRKRANRMPPMMNGNHQQQHQQQQSNKRVHLTNTPIVGFVEPIPSLALFRYPCSGRIANHSANISKLHFSHGTKPEYHTAQFELDGSCYEGDTLAGLRHGHGVAGYWNGCLYIGEFRKGQEHGLGELRDAGGSLIYRGEFEHGRICGQGTFYYGDGSVYRGEMREGTRHGKGIIWYQDGSVYEGDFVHGVRSGSGSFISLDGSQYNGEWSQDVRHGKGVLKLSDGTELDGQFKDNLPDGRCSVAFASDGSYYEGNFKDGLKDGRGTYTFGENKAVYEGRFVRDVIGGIGTLKLCSGIPIEFSHPTDSRKSEWMMPIELQCEIRSVHLKAGFALNGT